MTKKRNYNNNKKERTNVFARALDGFSKTIQASLVSFVVTVGKVETGHTKTGMNQFFQLVDFPALDDENKTDDIGEKWYT